MKLQDYQNWKKLTDIELAKKLGIHPSLLSHYRAGRRRPSPDMALKIAEVTNWQVTILELLYPDDPKDLIK